MFDSVPSRYSYVSERCCYIIMIPAFLQIPFTNVRHYICPFIAVHSQVTGYTMTVGVRPSPSDCTQYPCVQVYNHSVVTIRPTLYTVLLLPLSLHYNQLGMWSMVRCKSILSDLKIIWQIHLLKMWDEIHMKSTRQHIWKTWKVKNNGLRLKLYKDGTEDN